MWAGLTHSGLSLSLAAMAPVWGMLADRHGRKMMGAGIAAGPGLQSPFILAAGGVGIGTLTVSLWVREMADRRKQ